MDEGGAKPVCAQEALDLLNCVTQSSSFDQDKCLKLLNSLRECVLAKMAIDSGVKFEVERFDGTGNFRLWERRVKDLLAQQGLQKALRETKPTDMADDDWLELQEKAAGLIRLCVSDEVMYHILDLTSPKEVLDKLESQYISKTRMNRLFTKMRLYSLKMREGSDLQQHVNTFNNIITELVKLGVKIDDEDSAIMLLCSLPSSYKHLVNTLIYGKDTISLNVITATLLSHSRMSQNVEVGTQGKGLYVKESQDHGQIKGKAGSGKMSKSKNRKIAECYSCKQIGHWKRDCPLRK
ncbi:uncharacterized protein LOC123917602 [Trifolium pratense]|uniref:uncharacterized protein LOC123917602 n=1 Tax=Trifolium pratense TaxID=57577 RepID=UPI001E697E64|nr:uncharacterized protein LOC123917602 [Trifolium pratense]